MDQQNLLVLVVEDEHLLREAIAKKLTLSGITPIAVESGEDAIVSLEKAKELPDAIWLDYTLKGMNGMMFMGKLKEKSEWTKIPVIVVSNSASNEKVYNMLALGAKQYLLKAEHRLEDIIDTVREIVKKEK